MSVLYLEHFELKADPFRITPDTAFFFAGAGRGDILEGLQLAALHDDGIMCVIGEVGMGKTMLSRMLMERLHDHAVDTVYLPNPVFDRDEILDAIGRDLCATALSGNRAERVGALEKALIQRRADGRQVVMVIDEAHSMPGDTLEEIRLLSNLETAQSKLLKIILFGQPELGTLLEANSLRQVKDRISYRFQLQPLTLHEVGSYLDFRLRKAGYAGTGLFSPEAVQLLAQASDGRTRRLNMLADKTLLAAFAAGKHGADGQDARRACDEERVRPVLSSRGPQHAKPAPAWQLPVLATIVLTFGAAVGFAGARWTTPEPLSNSSSGLVTSESAAPASPGVTPQRPAAVAAAVAAAGTSTELPARPSTPAALIPASLDRPAAPPPARGTLQQRIAATEAAILASKGNGYTVQLMAVRAPSYAAVEAAVEQYQRLLGPQAVVWVNDRSYAGVPHHAIYTGQFGTRQAALDAIAALPSPLRAQKPVVRSLAKLMQEARP